MAVVAMVSAKGSPGVTTMALACTLTWSGRTVLAECDPAGGDLLASYLSRVELPPIGLLPLAAATLRDEADVVFAHQLVDLDTTDPGRRLALPGITDPVQAGTLRASWDRLAEFFCGLDGAQPAYDVIVDCGRLTSSAPPVPLLRRADVVLLVVRASSLRTVSPALPAAVQLVRELAEHGHGPGSIALVLVGDGPYPAGEIARRLTLPVLATLPFDPRTANVLGDGGRPRPGRPLLRAAAASEPAVRHAINARRERLFALSPGDRSW